MKKIWKIAGGLAVIAVVLIVTLAVLVKVLITPERVKARVLPLAQQTLHRQVELGDVEVSLFSGIVLKNLLIKEKAGDEPFVAANQVVLRYEFLPLLTMRVVIDEVRLDGPRITVIRQADGSFNFSDLAGEQAKETAAPAPTPVPAEDEKGSKPIDLVVANVVIDGGELQFIDYAVNPKVPYRYKLSDLTVQAKDLSLEQAFPFAVKANINGSSLQVDGKANLNTKTGQVKLQLVDFDVAAVSPYFRDKVPGKLNGLKLNLDLAVDGGAEMLTTKGKIGLNDLDLTLDALPKAPVREASIGLDYDVQVDLAKTAVQITKASLNLNGIGLDLSGRVVDYAKTPQVDLVLILNELDVREALAAVPKELIAQVEELDPAGTVHARINLAGTVDKPLALVKTGEISLSGLQASAGGIRPALTGNLALAGDQVSAEHLKLNLGDNSADINFKASNLFGKPIRVSTLVTSDRFLLDPLLKGGGAAPAAAGQETADVSGSPSAKQKPAEEIGPFDLPVNADGEVKIGQTLYKGLDIADFLMKFRLENNVFTIDTLTGKVAGGTFSETSTIDLGKKGLVYDAKLNLSGVQADPIVNAFAPKAAKTVFGNLNMTASFNGKGTLTEAIKKNLSGDGDLKIADGRLTGTSLLQGLSQFVQLDELKDLHFNQADGNFALKNGKVLMNGNFAGKEVSMVPKGSVDLDGNLDISLGTRLAPQLSAKLDKKGEVAQFFTDQEGWADLPLKVKGSLSKPSFAFDSSMLKSKAKEKAQSAIEKKLEEKVFKKLETKDSSGQTQEQPTKQLLDQAIKGLFGK